MDLIGLRDRIRSKAISSGLTYTEIETLFDVNELLNQTLPCLMWQYAGETNDFSESSTDMTLNVYLLANYHDSLKTETEAYQRDYIVTQYNALREYFITWVKALPFEGDDYLEVLTTEEIPIAERLSIEGFLTMEFRVNISLKRNFCIDPEEIAPTADEVKVYFNSLLKYTQACNVDLQLTLKNQDGDDIDATFTGYDIVVNQSGSDARVSNSDDTYDVSVASGGDLELPDVTISNSDNSFTSTSPSVQDIDLPNITLSNSDSSRTQSLPSVKDITISDVTISNSDSSYSATSPYDVTLSVPDITVSNSDNSYSVTSPSVVDVDIPDEAITINSTAFITKPSSIDQDILLRDQDDAVITPSSISGNKITITKEDGDISNSDNSYTASVPSGGALVIPDESITVNSAAFITKPSKKDQDILLKDVSGTSITPVSLSGDTITILDVVKDWDIIIAYSTGDITSTQAMRRAGTITSTTTSLTISSITINGVAVSTPITIALNDVLEITYTAAPSDGTIILEGTYV